MKNNFKDRFARFKINTGAALTLFALAALIAAAAFIQSGGGSVQAQQQSLDTPTPAPATDPDFPAPDRKPLLGNLDSMLSQLVESVEQGISTANSAAAGAPISQGESIAVTFYTQGDATLLADFLRANGGDPRNVGADYVEAYVPISLLVHASEQPGVISVDAVVPPQPADDAPLSLDSKDAPSKGNVTSEGVALHSATAWHTAGYTGAGVKVGIIDTNFTGFSALMGSELPANVTARCYTGIGEFSAALANCQSGDDNHGTIVAESLLDIAPDVSLYISNPVSWGDLKTTVEWMVSQNVNVINHSAARLWDGPGDGTSPYTNGPVTSVDTAVSGGVLWANAAGNEARSTWFNTFVNPDSDRWLNFYSTSEGNPVSLDAGEELTVQLRWQDTWTTASTDLDLYLYDSTNREVARSEDVQAGNSGDDPHEFFSYTPDVGGVYEIAVWITQGFVPRWVQLQTFTSQNLGYYTEGGSIGSPAESANSGLLAVGASHYWDTNTIASYSSRGPVPDGRTKPDITGAACASVAGMQAVTLSNGQRCWFPGTSQSSPHVAGLAALVKDAFPAYTPQQIAGYLKTNAQPRGAKPNNAWGHGFARLPAPPQTAAPATATATPSPTATSVSGGTDPVPTPVGGGGDLAGRVSALEQQTGALQRLVQSLQSLIQALTNRVAALEQGGGGGGPVATATATATPTATPSPTPTSVSGGTDPQPTPVGGDGDACVQPIEPGTISGTWTTDCVTAHPQPDGRNYYAKFYTFTLNAAAGVTITLSAADSTYIYLLAGAGTDGDIARSTGDTPATTNTIATRLQPGSYTIEATTYGAEVTGDFTLELTLAP